MMHQARTVRLASAWIAFILCGAWAAAAGAPRLILADEGRLASAKARLAGKDPALQPAYAALLQAAGKALKAGPYSVMQKTIPPPSGDKHDYMSFGPYWWPDPKKKDGLPYIRRDGEVNPDSRSSKSDHNQLGAMTDAVQTLALAYYFTGEEKYAARAATLLRAWFLEPATKMNPNLQFGQAVPGITTGRGTGLIDTTSLMNLPDAVALIKPSGAWTGADEQGLQDWFGKFLDWMLTSKIGRDEAAAKNNHGTYYDAQVAVYALFVGRDDVARQTLAGSGAKRVGEVKPDGRQPLELARTKSFGYSTMNLNGLLTLAWLGRRVGVDVAGYTTPDGGSIRKALDFMLHYADPANKWPYKQIKEYHPEDLYPVALRGAVIFGDEALLKAAEKLCVGEHRAERVRLLLNQ